MRLLIFFMMISCSLFGQRNAIRTIVTDTTELDLFVLNLGQGQDTARWVLVEKITDHRSVPPGETEPISGQITLRYSMPLKRGPSGARRMLALRRQALSDNEDEKLKEIQRLRRLRQSGN